jgi:hypothetical protein
LKENHCCQSWLHKPIIPALRRLRQENHEFKFSLGYKARPCLKQNKNQRKKKSRAGIMAHTYNPD